MALNPLPKFVKTTYAKYIALETKDENTLYFITDSTQHQLYLGSAPYTMTTIVLGSSAELPAVADAVPGALYYKQKDSTAHVFDGTAYRALSVPKTASMTGELAADDGTVPTTYAAQEFVKSSASSVAAAKIDKFNGTADHIVFVDSTASNAQVKDSGLIAGSATLASSPVSTTLATEAAVKAYADSAAADAAADKLEDFVGSNGNLVKVASNGSALEDSGVAVGGSAFETVGKSTVLATEKAAQDAIAAALSSANDYADSAVAALGTVFNYKGVVADIAALEAVSSPAAGDVYHVTSVAGGSSAEYIYNGTSWEELGTALDLSGYATKVVPAAANNIATLAADGSLQDSGKAIGGATLASAASADVLATEAAVKSYADAVASAAAGAYIPFVESATNSHIPVIGSAGQILTDSGLVAGGATLEASPASTVLATEAAVAAADAVVSSALDTAKIDKFNGTQNHVVFVDSTASNAQVKDSGYTVGGSAISASGSNVLATEEGVAAAIGSSADTKLDKISATSDNVVFFSSNGSAVADKGYGVDTTAFAATPSSTTLATEAAVADYVTSALQAIAWTTL